MVILPSRRKNFVSQGGGGENDPYWNNVVFLSRFDTSGAGRIFYDISSNPMTIAGAANVVLQTSSSPTSPKFGAGSIYFNNISAAFATGLHNDGRFALTAQEWTVEGWYYLTASTTSRLLFQTTFCRIIGIGASPGILNFQTSANNFTNIVTIASNINVGTGTWKHIAVQRKNTVSSPVTGVYDAFVDGVRVGGTTSTISSAGSSGINLGGFAGTANSYPHLLDELRVSTGIARYPTGVGASFSPPTAPYPSQ